MASQLASNYDPLGVASPCLLGGKLMAVLLLSFISGRSRVVLNH